MLCSFIPLESYIHDDRNVERRRSFKRTKVSASPFLTGFTTRFHNFIWFLIFTFTLYCMPNYELLLAYELHVSFSEAEAQEEASGGSVISTPLPQDLSFSGAAAYNIPIGVPPGRAGMAPSLSLIYNSYQGSGWIGVGWSLDLGAIQRSAKRGVNYSANDYVAAMNGSYSELVPASDWGANYYASKIEGAFLKHYLNLSTGGWEVTAKDGTKYYYGTTSASRQDSAYGVFKWCLDKVQDTKDNYMVVTYWKDQGEIYLDRIDYTGNGSLSPTNYVKFYPESRTDIPSMYPGNSLVRTAYRLKTVETYSNGLLQKKYVLNYGNSTSTSRSLLNTVTVYGSDGITALPSTGFGWTQASGFEDRGAWISGVYAEYAPYPGRVRNADVNGDGKADIVIGPDGYGQWLVMLSTGSSFEDKGAWISGAYANYAPYPDRIRNADVNGDGKADIVIGPDGYGQWLVMLSTGSSFEDKGAWISGVYAEYAPYPGRVRMVDVNGDGKTDIVIGPDGYGKWYVMLSTGTSFEDKGAWISGAYANYAPYPGRVRNADVNGDGKDDIVIGPDGYGQWLVMLSTGSSFEDKGAWISGAYAAYAPYPDRVRMVDVNGDGMADIVIGPDDYGKWYVMLSTGSSFEDKGEWISGAYANYAPYPGRVRNADVNGDGRADIVIGPDGYGQWLVMQAAGPTPDLITTITNGIGGTSTITYTPSSAYNNTLLPFVLQTVSSISANDGKGNILTTTYAYEGGLYDYPERDFRGFRKVTSYQTADSQHYESKTETWFLQDYFGKGRIETQIQTSKEGHTSRVDNTWENIPTPGGGNFPSLKETTSTITDLGYPSYSHRTTYIYDQYGNVKEEHKYGMTSDDEVHTYFSYTNSTDKWIVSKPTDINVKNSTQSIVGRKWMDYDSNIGNMLTEEVCKSDNPNTGCASRNSTQNPVITYQYYPEGNPWKITDPRNNTTTINYDATKTFVYETINCLGHKTTTEYDPGTGKLKKLIPPHLQGTSYWSTNTYDVFGRKIREDRPDGGWTSYGYLNFGNPNTQYVQKQEHIIGGPSVLDHYSYTFFDGLGRTYWVESTGPDGKRTITETWYDNLGRVWDKSNPYFYGIDTPYYTSFTYDGLSRVIDVFTPDDYHIRTSYQGLNKVVTDQNNHSTANTYDVYQRLKKVSDTNGTTTEYSYDTLGNLLQVIAAKGAPEQNTISMTYDSLSKKRTMNDPDMGQWAYDYDKSGNLISQTDAKSQTITFIYDGLNRLTQKTYPTHTVTYTYDDPSIPYSTGKQTKVSDLSGTPPAEVTADLVLEYDLMQRMTKGQKKIEAQSVSFQKTYDTAGRVLSITYPGGKVYSYEYDVAGDLLYVKDNASGNHLVDYSDFTALGQQKSAAFPKPNNVSVKSAYTYDPQTARLKTLLTQKLLGANPTDTYQNLDYQQFDGRGNLVTLADTLNGINHSYTYDPLNRLLTANGVGTNAYSQSYQYDRIGNITYKSDFGSYSYDYSNKPHAVKSVVTDRPVYADPILDITYNYDNKPELIKKSGSNYVQFTYDGSSQRVKKYNYTTGQTTLYFGELYEIRGGAGIIHVFAGNKRVASVLADGRTQFYHSNHLGSSSVITDGNGDRKEKIEYFPFGTYRETLDDDPNFPDVFYTFTGQEDDDDLGLYNYNARLYDPALGRFISPDRLVPYPGNLQAFNRYAYCLNNPLIYTDPSGEFFIFDDIIEMIILSVIVGSTMGAYRAKRSGENVYKGAMIGGIRGLISSNPIGAVADSSMVGAIQAKKAGKNPAAGAMLGGSVSAATYAIGQFAGGSVLGSLITGALSGAANAELSGGNVWKGALYGGLYSVASAVTVQGAIALNESINSYSNSPTKTQGAENNGKGGGDPEELEKLLAEINPLPKANYDPSLDPGFPDADAYKDAAKPAPMTPGDVKFLTDVLAVVLAAAACAGGPGACGLGVGGAIWSIGVNHLDDFVTKPDTTDRSIYERR